MVRTPEYKANLPEYQPHAETPVDAASLSFADRARRLLGLPPKQQKKFEQKEAPVMTKEFNLMDFGHVSAKPLSGGEWEVTFVGRGTGRGTVRIDQETFSQWRYMLENMHRVFQMRAHVNEYTPKEVVGFIRNCEKKMPAFQSAVKYLAKPHGHEHGNPDVIHGGKPGDLFFHEMDTIGKDFWTNGGNFEKLAEYERSVGVVWDERSMWQQKKAS